jgi:ribosomal protein S18 acetylase RimI-like enzyme
MTVRRCQNDGVVSIPASTTIEGTDHPYLRRHVDPAAIRGIWRYRSATVFAPLRDVGEDPGLVCLGAADDLAVLLDELSRSLPTPTHLSMTAGATGALPTGWPVREWHGWTAFSIQAVPRAAGMDAVIELPLPRWTAEISSFLDEANPAGWGRPGRDDSQWWGVLDGPGGRLLSVGGVRTSGAPSAHVSGIATHPSARGRGLASAVTAVLTRVGLDAGQSIVTLDAYSANEPALRMYDRLGYVVDARFRSGEVES